jgi:PPOX class probable F420-dependent enzyme
MAPIPESARALLKSNALAHLVTLNPDGSPQVTCVWVGLDGDEIVAGHAYEHRKVKNIRRDGRVALSIETDRMSPTAPGLLEYLVIRGNAYVTEGGSAELLQRLARVYIAPDAVFPPEDHRRPGYITHIVPTWFGGTGPWSEGH